MSGSFCIGQNPSLRPMGAYLLRPDLDPEVIWAILKEHQEARALVTDQVVEHFMNPHRSFDHTRHPKEAIAASNEDQHIGFHFDPYFRK